jgi:hypothetical protein
MQEDCEVALSKRLCVVSAVSGVSGESGESGESDAKISRRHLMLVV